eukprot:scaffold846_cov149-Skeletonema_marinoi.AAC.4
MACPPGDLEQLGRLRCYCLDLAAVIRSAETLVTYLYLSRWCGKAARRLYCTLYMTSAKLALFTCLLDGFAFFNKFCDPPGRDKKDYRKQTRTDYLMTPCLSPSYVGIHTYMFVLALCSLPMTNHNRQDSRPLSILHPSSACTILINTDLGKNKLIIDKYWSDLEY